MSHYVHCVFYVRRVSAGIQFCIFRGAISLSYAFLMKKKGAKSSENKEKDRKPLSFRSFGGDKRDRTADLLNAIQALSQLSHTPKFSYAVRQLSYYNII